MRKKKIITQMQGKLERERESEGLTTEASPYWSRHRRWLTYSGDVWWPVLREREREREDSRGREARCVVVVARGQW
jgi:hypothetical protein